ncbi:MAG TPA: hypothetical protein VH764_17535 [Gemmatimonadales bacterium]
MLRAVVVWTGILGLAACNGALRDLVVAPRLGDTVARALSTVILCALILLVAHSTIGWIGPRNAREAFGIGALWLALTLAFEFGSGLYAGKSWSVMLEDYNVLRGRIWVLVPILTFLAPLWAGRAAGRW